jgi:uncharacterized protein (UPF0305 family)
VGFFLRSNITFAMYIPSTRRNRLIDAISSMITNTFGRLREKRKEQMVGHEGEEGRGERDDIYFVKKSTMQSGRAGPGVFGTQHVG